MSEENSEKFQQQVHQFAHELMRQVFTPSKLQYAPLCV